MSESEGAQSAIQALASSPRVAATVAASTATLGAAGKFEMIHGWLSIVSLSLGILTAVVVLVIQSIKLIRVWREWKADQPNHIDIA